MTTKTERALALIRERGTIRSDELGTLLEIPSASALLKCKVDDGTLVSCKVERPGKPPCNEYRLSTAGGGRTTEWNPLREAKRERGLRAMQAHHGATPKNGAVHAPVDDMLARGAELGRKTEPQHPPVQKVHDSVVASAARAPHGSVAIIKHFASEEPLAIDAPRSEGENIGPILKGVPLPTAPLRAALAELAIGECRDFVGFTKTNIYNAGYRASVRVVVRPHGDGFRVWRTG